MRILFVAPYIPSKIRVRPYNFIKGLRKNGHIVSFLGLADFYANKDTEEELTKYCNTIEIFKVPKMRSNINRFFGLFRNIAMQSAWSFSKEMRNRILKISLHNKFDMIHIEHIRAGYSLPVKRTIPAVYDSVDCITSLYQQFAKEASSIIGKLAAFIEFKKLEKYEPTVLSKYDGVIVTSEKDKFGLTELSEKSKRVTPKIKVIQNGVDSKYFKSENQAPQQYSIVFSGKMGYRANELAALHFARDIFPLIRKMKPDSKFYIVGANPSAKIKELEREGNIVVIGQVLDMREYLDAAQVVVCPIRVAVGIQNKLLEAMAMGKAVVTYPNVALPLKPSPKDIFLLANDPKKFAEQVLKLMDNRSLRLTLGLNARTYVQEFYNWDEKVGQLEEFYRETIIAYEDRSKNW